MVNCINACCNSKWIVVFFSLFAYILIVLLIKFIIIKLFDKNEKFIDKIVNIFKYIFLIFTIEYFITYLFKKKYKDNLNHENVENSKNRLGRLIILFNYANLSISIVLMIVVLIIHRLNHNSFVFNFVYYFSIIRFLLRILEVVVSFTNDIIERKKCSSITNENRIKLAFISLLEVIILTFSCILLIKDNIYSTIVDSLSPLFFDFSKCNRVKMIQLFEAISFYSLVTLYIASIVSFSKDNKEKDNFIAPEYMKIYVKVPAEWDKVCCYYWCNLNSDGFDIDEKDKINWPGKLMELNGDKYSIIIPKNTNMIIFNNNGNKQTVDIPLKKDNLYTVREHINEDGKYDCI